MLAIMWVLVAVEWLLAVAMLVVFMTVGSVWAGLGLGFTVTLALCVTFMTIATSRGDF